MEVEFKLPPPENGVKVEENAPEIIVVEEESLAKTRSRSKTPQKKRQNGGKQEVEAEEQLLPTNGEAPPIETPTNGTETIEEMDSLCVTDEPDPELQFEDNSDLESGKGSPLIGRCKTRRSQTRNIPTPKTPKSLPDDNSEQNSIPSTPTPPDSEPDHASNKPEDSNSSTKVEVGGDSTRLEATFDEDYLKQVQTRSLSARRSIRHLSSDYVYSSPRPMGGVKRKADSATPEQQKKTKFNESSSFLSRLSSPLQSLKTRLWADVPSSTPTLTGYVDNNTKFVLKDTPHDYIERADTKKTWCAIM